MALLALEGVHWRMGWGQRRDKNAVMAKAVLKQGGFSRHLKGGQTASRVGNTLAA